MVDQPETMTIADHVEDARRKRSRAFGFFHLAVIAVAAIGLRCFDLERTSLWYDEVVTMQVAQSDGLRALVERLDQIDGTRAPLHPLVLNAWLRVFGPSDRAGRAFSAFCGMATVAVIYLLGRQAFDESTGRWSAWLAAFCPPLVYYSREARMYAWLVLLTCLSWLVALSFRHQARPSRQILYGLLLTSLVYSHPLGLFMVAAHGIAFLVVRPALRLTLRAWLTIQGAVIVSIVPWIGRYMDHGTDYPMPRHPIRFLLAIPIEYVGGNSLVLGVCMAVIVFGMFKRDPTRHWHHLTMTQRPENLSLLVWAVVPPALMYGYSYAAQPIFGPPRYHLFIAPAYLILLAHGAVRLPALIRWPFLGVALVLSLLLLRNYEQALKADWRGLSVWLHAQEHDEASNGGVTREPIMVVVHPSDPRFPREQVEAARYYLSPRYQVAVAGELTSTAGAATAGRVYEIDCLPGPRYSGIRDPDQVEFYGLRVRRKTTPGL